MLTPKKKRFAEEYLVDLNATQAAIRAGYSAHTANEQGSRLLADASVKAIVEAHQKKLSEKVQITVEDVLRDLQEIKERCMQKVPVLDDEGNETGEWKFEANAAIKSLELVAKHLGMFTEKIDINVSSHRRIIDQIKMRQVNPIKVDEDDE